MFKTRLRGGNFGQWQDGPDIEGLEAARLYAQELFSGEEGRPVSIWQAHGSKIAVRHQDGQLIAIFKNSQGQSRRIC